MADYENNDPKQTYFAIFPNDYQKTDKQPEMRGTIEINRELARTMTEKFKEGGFPVKMDIAIWNERMAERSGNKFRRANFQMGYVKPVQVNDPLPDNSRKKETPITEPDDDLPF